jgi:hypothetical protein
MPTNYPAALDDSGSLPTKTSGDTVTSAETNTQSGAVKAIEAKLGIGSSTPAQGKELGSTATGTTDWRTRHTIDARDYGALPNSGADELGHLQAALTAAGALGGGVVKLLAGTYLVSDKLVISTNGVILEGSGQESTIVKRTGATTNTVIALNTLDGALPKIYGAGIRHLMIDGNSTAVYGLHITTVNFAVVQNVTIQGGTVTQLLMDCWDTRPVSGDARDTQQCALRDLRFICTGSQGGLKVTGNTIPDANSSLNIFDNLFAQIVDGDAFYFGNCDGNYANHLRVYQASGTGRGLVLGASSGVSGGHARNNWFSNVQTAATGVFALSDTTPSGPNFILFNTGNGGSGARPSIAGSAVLYYISEDGVYSPSITLPNGATSGSNTPDSGYNRIYAGSEGRFHWKDSSANTGLVGSAGFMPYVFANSWGNASASTDAVALIAVTAGLGGAIAVPVFVTSPMIVKSYTIRQGATASLRTAEARLYRDNGTGSVASISGTDATWSFTPAAVDNRTANVSGTPLLYPGTYWLVVRNTSTSQTFSIRRNNAAAGELAPAFNLGWNTTGIAALGSSLDFTTAETKNNSSLFAIRVDGTAYGSSW